MIILKILRIWYPFGTQMAFMVAEMPAISLTQRAVELLKPPASGRTEYFDRALPGFGLRVSEGGRKTWFVMYRVQGQKVRETLGTFAAIPNVGDARNRARQSIDLAQSGVHPVRVRKGREADAAARAITFGTVADRYLVEYVERNTRPKTIRETRRIIERDVKPEWGDRPIREIGRHDMNALLDRIADRGALIQANRTLARLKTLFSWALDQELIETDPTLRIRKRVREVARDRALRVEEIRHFWHACERIGWPFGPLFKLLLVTAQRREEVCGMRWSELDLDQRLWSIPRERAKNGRAHEVHLSDLAMEIIDALPQIVSTGSAENGGGQSEFVFTTHGRRPVSGFTRPKDRVDEYMLAMLREDVAAAGKDRSCASVGKWILHDLRRTAATGMAGLNIAPHVVDRILNHVSGTIRGVAAVYNRHAYIDERKSALEVWASYLENIIGKSADNVVHIKSARTAS